MNLKNYHINKSWALFLDRDGVLNKKIPFDYVKHPGELEILQGVLEAFPILSRVFGRILIATNQQGIGKGLMTTKDLDLVHKVLLDKVTGTGGRIDKFYYCPELAEKNSRDRKPNIGMALKAQKDFPEINFSKSIMIGDSYSDMLFGKNAGMITVYISEEKRLAPELAKVSDYICSSLAEFADKLHMKAG